MDPLASRDLWPAGAQPPERTVLATTTNYIRRVLSTDYFAERSRSRVSRAATELRHPYILFRFDSNIVFSFFLFDLHLYPRSRIHSNTFCIAIVHWNPYCTRYSHGYTFLFPSFPISLLYSSLVRYILTAKVEKTR